MERLVLASPRELRPLFAISVVGLCVVAALGLTYSPYFTVGLAIAGAFLAIALMAPLVAIGLMLAFGIMDMSPLTGGLKALLQGAGGLDMNGLRLIALVLGLGLVVISDARSRREAIGPYGRWYLAFLVLAASGIVVSVSVVDGARQWFKLAYLFLVFIAVLTLPRRQEQLERLGDAMLAGGALVAWVVNPLMILFGQYVVDHGRIRLTLLATHQNPESFYFLVIILFAVARYAVRRQARYLLLSGACFVWIALAIARIALLAAVAAALAVAVTAALAARNRRAVWGTVGVCAILVALLLPAALVRTFGYIPSPEALWAMVRHPDFFWLSRHIAMEGREIYWPVVFGMFVQHPVLGAGLGSSRGVLLSMFPASWSGAVHNEYLRLLSETGLVGTALFSGAVIYWTVAAFRAARTPDPLAREFALAAVGAAVIWGVTALTDNALDYYNQYAQHVVFLLAAAIATTRLAQAARAAPAGATDAQQMGPT